MLLIFTLKFTTKAFSNYINIFTAKIIAFLKNKIFNNSTHACNHPTKTRSIRARDPNFYQSFARLEKVPHLPRFHVPFKIRHILVYLFYLYTIAYIQAMTY